jgi:hypothetical protein
VGLLQLPPRTACDYVPQEKQGEHWFQAIRTVAQPWFGRHHVYGVFIIPNAYKFDHLFAAKLIIQGTHQEFPAGSPEDSEISNLEFAPGHYQKRVYLSTRTTLAFLATGRFGDLRSTCHWWLIISKR